MLYFMTKLAISTRHPNAKISQRRRREEKRRTEVQLLSRLASFVPSLQILRSFSQIEKLLSPKNTSISACVTEGIASSGVRADCCGKTRTRWGIAHQLFLHRAINTTRSSALLGMMIMMFLILVYSWFLILDSCSMTTDWLVVVPGTKEKCVILWLPLFR